MIIPYINIFRFQQEDVLINYNTKFPFIDNMRLGVEYQKGIKASNYVPDFLINKTIYIQLFFKSRSENPNIILPDGSIVPMTRTTLHPSGWSGGVIRIVSYTPTIAGEYSIRLTLSRTHNVYISDTFSVHDGLEKELVEIKFYDSQNRYGGYFTDGSSILWQPTAYYTGRLEVGTPEDDQSTYDDQDGDTTILQATPKRIQILTLTDIHTGYIDGIKQQSVCDYFYVNGVRFAASDMSVEKKGNTDLVDITFKLTQKNNEYDFLY